ncbi:DUF3040 domain-containing protein [Kribbella sp.]|uniref:DUF3040 domain-containing protein n=1 Tax=Kribbella sp. TaxID=1871183 RepID=UPI002D722896|nr:DUF3040 domain-containing protein [Kribbella sp.]HZX03958.1 DUF3040 domain-containing protein [Kribbella sp.]
MKLSDDEQQKLVVLERALRAEDPKLDHRLAGMRQGGVASLHVVLGLSFGVVLGVMFVALGDLLAVPALLVAGLVLTVSVPTLAVVWWARRYYCRYCAGKWAAPASWCPRCARPTPV